jgi:hypothetical protein
LGREVDDGGSTDCDGGGTRLLQLEAKVNIRANHTLYIGNEKGSFMDHITPMALYSVIPSTKSERQRHFNDRMVNQFGTEHIVPPIINQSRTNLTNQTT